MGPHRPWSEDPLPSSPYFSGEVGAASRVLDILDLQPWAQEGLVVASGWQVDLELGSAVPTVTRACQAPAGRV